jgi:hypothetical protein
MKKGTAITKTNEKRSGARNIQKTASCFFFICILSILEILGSVFQV